MVNRDDAEKIYSVVLTEKLSVLASQIAETDKVNGACVNLCQLAIQYKDKSISSFYNRCHELSIVDVCLVWGRCVAIPQVLHINHLDMSRMKPVARSYLCWLHLDSRLLGTITNVN